MHYLSTRGHQAESSFSDILLGGLAPDGGLFLPSHYPRVSDDELRRWRGLSYAGLASEILKKFATDIPASDIEQLALGPTPPRFIATRAPMKTFHVSPLCVPSKCRATVHWFYKPYPTVRRWPSKTWRCSSWVIFSNTRSKRKMPS